MKYLILPAIICLIACSEKEERSKLVMDPTPAQVFTIRADSGATIVGKKGTKLAFQPRSFVNRHGESVVGDVHITLKEFYTVEDFINNRLTTKTNDGRLLRSSGMVYVEAKSDTAVLFLQADKPMTISFPRVQESPVANLFAGVQDERGDIAWTLLEPVHYDTIIRTDCGCVSCDCAWEHVQIIVADDTLSHDQVDSRWLQRRLSSEWPTDTFVLRQPDYVFETTQLNYINCDFFVPEKLRRFTVRLDNSQSDVFLSLDGSNSLLMPDSIVTSTHDYLFRVPENLPVTILAYRQSEKTHQLGKLSTTTRADALAPVRQEAIDREKMIELIKGIK